MSAFLGGKRDQATGSKMRMKIRIVSLLVSCFLGLGQAGAFDGGSDEILTGPITVADLKAVPYRDWFDQHTRDYEVNDAAVAGLADLMDNVDVTIVMGTWCHDSQREVPRFYKILQAAGIPRNRVQMLAVDQNFMTPENKAKGLKITNTPTFIFSRSSKELNRIVETPVESLEQDMMALLKGKDYRHSKMAD